MKSSTTATVLLLMLLVLTSGFVNEVEARKVGCKSNADCGSISACGGVCPSPATCICDSTTRECACANLKVTAEAIFGKQAKGTPQN